MKDDFNIARCGLNSARRDDKLSKPVFANISGKLTMSQLFWGPE
jgi:hypothetical protein